MRGSQRTSGLDYYKPKSGGFLWRRAKSITIKKVLLALNPFSCPIFQGPWAFLMFWCSYEQLSVQLSQPNCCQAFPKLITVEIKSGKPDPRHDRLLVSAWLPSLCFPSMFGVDQSGGDVREKILFFIFLLHMDLLFCTVNLPGSSISTTVFSPWPPLMTWNFGST